MQQNPETGEQVERSTTPLPPHPTIRSFRTAYPGEGRVPRAGRWTGSFLPFLGGALVLLVVAVILLTSPLGQGLIGPAHTPGGRAPAGGRAVGSVSFESSDQRNGRASLGVADELHIDLTGIPAPTPGNSYYGWLLPDRSRPAGTPAFALGMLQVDGGSIHVLYADRFHRNLLGLAGAFLVTEEGASGPPLQPSPDQITWRYQAIFPQVDDAHHYSELDHLRSLLFEDPGLAALGLHGGLDAWFYHNIQKIFESAGAARGYFGQASALPLLRAHLDLILYYLDGTRYADFDLGRVASVPPPFEAQVGLIQVTATAEAPPAYINLIDLHLKGVISAPGATGTLRARARETDKTLAQVADWLAHLRTLARQLVAMTDAQLLRPQAEPLLGEADTLAQYAFVGQASPTANAVMGGATQIHYATLRLATLQVQAVPRP